MEKLVAEALPLLPLTLLPALLLLLAPMLGVRGRTAYAAVLAVFGLGLIVDVLVLDHTRANTLEVPNAFPRGPDGDPFVWHVETVTAPAWHYHVFAAAMLLLAAVVLFVRRRRAPAPPVPVLHGAIVFWFYLALRLGLEKTAAPQAVVWGTGGTFALLLTLPFVGWWCGARGLGFGGLVGRIVLMAYLQRLPLVAFAFVATTRHLGTHLDTHAVEEIAPPGVGEMQLATDLDRWLWPTLVPHLTLWVVLTLVAGIVLASLPWWAARRRRRASTGEIDLDAQASPA